MASWQKRSRTRSSPVRCHAPTLLRYSQCACTVCVLRVQRVGVGHAWWPLWCCATAASAACSSLSMRRISARRPRCSVPPAAKNSRHKGKQFQTNPAKRTDGGGGFFAKKTYTPEEYSDRLSTLRVWTCPATYVTCRARFQACGSCFGCWIAVCCTSAHALCCVPRAAAVYTKNQPLDSRKLGFGSHNAKNRDEFTLHIRTEQYRELLKVRDRLGPGTARCYECEWCKVPRSDSLCAACCP